MKTIARLSIATAAAVAALVAALAIDMPASRAGSYGDAPWCAVQNLGAGEMVWDCEYQTMEQCAPQVLAGNRGFCNLNPAWSPPPGAAPRFYRKRHHA
jgi:hypothetical protein